MAVTGAVARRALALSFALALGRAGAQSSPTVQPADPVYRDLELLHAAGLVDSIDLGMRPYSRAAMARLAARADSAAALAGALPAATRWALERLNARIDGWRADVAGAGALRGRAVDEIALDATVLRSPTRGLPDDNGIGQIRGDLNPLADAVSPRRLYDGSSLALETEHSVLLGGRLSLVARTRGVLGRGGDGRARYADARMERLAARVVLGNVAVEAGRDHLAWGQGRGGGLTLSDHAPPLDGFRLSSDHAFALPWLFRHLGPTSLDFFAADLGADQHFPHTKLLGWRASVEPWPWFSLALHLTDEMGGRGAQPFSAQDAAIDLFPIIDAFLTGSDLTFSNKLAGGDIRVRVPRARGLELFFEHVFDDVDSRRMASSIWQDGGQIFGIVVPRLTSDGRLGARFEAHHTGIRYYEHVDFLSGMTAHRRLLGDPLGPHGAAGYLTVDWQSSRERRTSLDAGYEWRANDWYTFFVNGPQAEGFRFVVLERRPTERRARLVVTHEQTAGADMQLLFQGGWERVDDFAFRSTRPRDNAVARIALTRRF